MAERSPSHGPSRGLVTALALAFTLLAGCASGAPDEDEAPTQGLTVGNDDGMNGAMLTDQYVVSATPLTDTDGSSYSLAKDTDRPMTLVFFGYTHCPDICIAVMSSLASAMTRLDESQRAQVDVVFVTTDPARDDEATLREYLDRFDTSFIGLTGDLADITEVAGPLGVAIEKGRKLPTGGYDVGHSNQVVAVNGADRSPIVWTEGTSPAQFAEDLAVLLEA